MPNYDNPYAALAALANRPERQAARDNAHAKRERTKAAAIASTEARQARNARLAASASAVQSFASDQQRNGDYFTVTRNGPAFTSTKRS